MLNCFASISFKLARVLCILIWLNLLILGIWRPRRLSLGHGIKNVRTLVVFGFKLTLILFFFFLFFTNFLDNKTLIFDMDETLIHCNENTNLPSDVIVELKFPTGKLIKVSISFYSSQNYHYFRNLADKNISFFDFVRLGSTSALTLKRSCENSARNLKSLYLQLVMHVMLRKLSNSLIRWDNMCILDSLETNAFNLLKEFILKI